MIGRLGEQALKHDWIEYMAGVSMVVGALALIVYMFYAKKWKWLWREWITSVDHKKIGIMYIVVSAVMLFKGMVDGGMMRAQQMFSYGDSMGYLGPDHFQQIFTAHGVTMIFFVGMGVTFGIINLVLPLQIGARDVAFPFLNNLSFWLFTSGGMYIFISLIIGNYAGTGWTSYPPLAGAYYSPGVGVDYWIWSIQISGVGSLLSGVNFLVTILKMRCPGMTMMRMPIFVWATFATVILVIFAFPILTTVVALISSDRLIGTHFFTSEMGGNPMMYINMIWAWGHPEVYILILPFFGVFSELVPVFAQKRLFGYKTMVYAIFVICFLSFVVWLHHFFTMGAGANVNAFFGIMTMIISVPTGVKVFNWLFTMYRGQIKFNVPMYWFIGFVLTFTLGGMAGVMMSIPAVDFQVHNSLFLIAHFHTVIIGGVVFGFFAAYNYWFPKFTGFMLDERLGKAAFWCWLGGFLVAFFPLYLLGFMGATRRMHHYPEEFGWHPLFFVAALGVIGVFAGLVIQLYQLYKGIKHRHENRDTTGDPWNGRTLEWSTTSPPPFYNFAHIPEVHETDAFFAAKQKGESLRGKGPYSEIHMPKSTPYGFYIGALSCVFGFAMVFYLWTIATLTFLGMVACTIIRLMQTDIDYHVPVSEIEKLEASS